jgi:hypothetical protein
VRSTPCTWRRGEQVSWLSFKTKVDGLSVVWPQNRWQRFVSGLPQNHSDGFRWFGLKTGGDGFWRFGIKTCYDGFLLFGLKTSDDGFSLV